MRTMWLAALAWGTAAAAAPLDRGLETRATVDAAGQVTECRVLRGSGRMRADGCGVFGNARFLRYALGRDYARVRRVEARLGVSTGGEGVSGTTAPDAYRLLAEASVSFDRTGRMTGCRTIKSFVAPGRTVDLCELMQADPPRFAPAARPRTALYLLELSGSAS